jgi:hypothetical protein
LDAAARLHPNSWWWIKSDGCDIVSGLGESVHGEWSDEVNVDQKALDAAYQKYKEMLEWVAQLGLGERQGDLEMNLDTVQNQVTDDINFITTSKYSCSRRWYNVTGLL